MWYHLHHHNYFRQLLKQSNVSLYKPTQLVLIRSEILNLMYPVHHRHQFDCYVRYETIEIGLQVHITNIGLMKIKRNNIL